ncbi:acyl-CoA carboxylase epsilon subunit [Streptomyces profundus]|uniref:acyl-CoA carboxylase epsilon subunit n=1 Tax=Streptomyces profundus TaxID=2867410 RepID=UPI001D16592B|nr:acyl-CoA carboxylase epsilon subunit [Streptomyces sp. MA3_2.13]UED84468.1 acyl-CoA carboxylase subunit epsilon [Streptomyces sp. MA3_2.13]
MISVIRGNPTPEELAAAIAATLAVARTHTQPPPTGPTPANTWSTPTPPTALPPPGPHAWRTSYWPR